MRKITTIIFIIFSFYGLGQEFNYPILSKTERNIENFIPLNWKILKSVKGDLNKDSLSDFAVVFQFIDSVKLINIDSTSEEVYRDTVITQPRILALFFYNKATKQFDLIEQSNTFILNHDNPNMDEPLQDINIRNNVLTISFFIFMNSGGWGMSNNIYRFRYQDNSFKLIGADYNSTNRGSGKVENRSYNFLTRKELIETGNISNNKLKKQRKKISILELKTLKTFPKPFTYEIEKGIYL